MATVEHIRRNYFVSTPFLAGTTRRFLEDIGPVGGKTVTVSAWPLPRVGRDRSMVVTRVEVGSAMLPNGLTELVGGVLENFGPDAVQIWSLEFTTVTS